MTTAVSTPSPGTTLGQLIAKNQRKIMSVLPKHIDADRLARLALSEANRNPQLLQCTPESFIGSLIQSAQLGLEPGVAGMGYLIPRRNKGKLECTFQAGYKGLMDLARRSGKVGALSAAVVYEDDKFDYAMGTTPFIKHRPSMSVDRGEITHAYAVAHLIGSDDWQFVIKTRAEIEKIRNESGASKSGPWRTHPVEMYLKTVMRALTKWLPMSVEDMAVIAREESIEVGADSAASATPSGLDLSLDVSSHEDPSLASKITNSGVEDAEVEE